MGIRYEPRVYNVNDFVAWSDNMQLELSPKFQRRSVWTKKAQSYLIDTIIRNLPIPPVHLRERTDIKSLTTVREVVDGQQRLATILSFLRGDLRILPSHNEELAGQSFLTIGEELQRQFLTYQIPVALLHGASDADVIQVFSRLNANTLPLNSQEKLNARFYGRFKQTIYGLGGEHLEFWRAHRILTERGIARMGEAELTGLLVVMGLLGTQGGKEGLETLYTKYDEQFPKEATVVDQFRSTISEIERIAGQVLNTTRWRQKALFYSLYGAVFHMLFGLPGEKAPRPKSVKDVKVVQDKLGYLSSAIDSPEIWAYDADSHLQYWYDSSTSTTDNKPQRANRLRFTLKALSGTD